MELQLVRASLGCWVDGQIIFWDRRTGKQCGAFTDTHAEDVTQVCHLKHPIQPDTCHSKEPCSCAGQLSQSHCLDLQHDRVHCLSTWHYNEHYKKCWSIGEFLQVKFCQSRLLSGSVDGLISVFDVANGFDEDDGFLVSWLPVSARIGAYVLHECFQC